ncbi:MAG: methyltransferase domain-containing protein, partial [Verrucomicrobia bacterium]|nr:methyltransferase domain-containing protein [Verrucomicrobiota bacterium]
MSRYVHGYSEREAERLHDQAGAVCDLLHHDTLYPPGSLVLEAGCGVGAQTVTLARQSEQARFVSVDISPESLEKARALAAGHGLRTVEFRQADLFALPFSEASFDHVFVCFVLEHLAEPEGALACLRRVLKPGGTITVIEGDHGSCYFHPEGAAALRAWRCLIESQARLGGDSLIGRRLFPLLQQAGFQKVRVSPRVIYGDHSLPVLVDSFWGRTIIPMVEGVKEKALAMGLVDEEAWRLGLRELHEVIERKDGTFNYTFFKAVAVR